MSKRLWIVLGLLALFAVACATPEEKKTAFYDKGVAFFEAGEYIKARLEFKNALQIDPEFAPAYYMLGKNAIKLKDGKAAYKSFMTAVRFDPEMIDARLDLGKMLFAGRAHDRAMAEVEEILKRAPGNTDALYLKASILLAQKKNEEAGILLDAVSQTGDEHPEFYLLRASYYSQKKNDKAVLTSLEKGFERHPDSLSMALALTRYYGKKRDIDRVEYYLGRAIEISPETLRLRFNLAWIHLKKNDLEKARLVLNRIITTHPGQDSLRVGASVLLLKGGQEAAAVDMIREGIAQSPSIYSYYALLSEVELKRDNMPEAETVLNRFLALGDDAARADQIKARLNLSKLMLLENRFEDADNMIAAILEEDLQNIDAHYLKGKLFLVRGNGSEAVLRFRAVTDEHPGHLEGHIGLANAHALNEDYDLALDVLKKALKRAPNSTKILKGMVRVNVLKKDTRAAEQNLKQIISLDPYNLGAIAGLGDFYLSM
ncbi:MAG: tetratricopeptide repeat protein, partial [Desulfobacterales bacterium]|nr:tetratricopeptide repeat protein [Desulfobacterales bacterium]